MTERRGQCTRARPQETHRVIALAMTFAVHSSFTLEAMAS